MEPNPILATGYRILGPHGPSLAILRVRLLRGEPAGITAERWCEAWLDLWQRLYPDQVHPRDCYRCEGQGHYGGRLCEVCEGFCRKVVVDHCPSCRGYGYTVPLLPEGHPQFGLAVVCPRCGGEQGRPTYRDIDPRLALQQAHVPDGYAGFTLASYLDRPGLTDSQTAAAMLVAGWAELVEAFRHQHEGKSGIVLAGPVGAMKTGLAVGALAEAAKHCERPRFASWLGLLAMLRHTWHSRDGGMTQREIIDTYGRARVLVLDDFGTTGTAGGAPEHVVELAEALWEARSTRMDGWTLVTTNLPDWTAIADEFGARVASRMRGHCVWHAVSGPDARLEGEDVRRAA